MACKKLSIFVEFLVFCHVINEDFSLTASVKVNLLFASDFSMEKSRKCIHYRIVYNIRWSLQNTL